MYAEGDMINVPAAILFTVSFEEWLISHFLVICWGLVDSVYGRYFLFQNHEGGWVSMLSLQLLWKYELSMRKSGNISHLGV